MIGWVCPAPFNAESGRCSRSFYDGCKRTQGVCYHDNISAERVATAVQAVIAEPPLKVENYWSHLGTDLDRVDFFCSKAHNRYGQRADIEFRCPHRY